jgi:hypothetical protein
MDEKFKQKRLRYLHFFNRTVPDFCFAMGGGPELKRMEAILFELKRMECFFRCFNEPQTQTHGDNYVKKCPKARTFWFNEPIENNLKRFGWEKTAHKRFRWKELPQHLTVQTQGGNVPFSFDVRAFGVFKRSALRDFLYFCNRGDFNRIKPRAPTHGEHAI